MRWFRRNKSRPPEELRVPTTRFIGEQDGTAERDLKARFVQLFPQDLMIQSAYLVRADHGDGTGVHVTLAIRHNGGGDPALVPKLANIFSNMFGSHEHLDVMFIRDDEEQELQMVCAPFYRAPIRQKKTV